MKAIIKSLRKIPVTTEALVLLMLLLVVAPCFSVNGADIKSRLQLSSTQFSTGDIELKAKLYYKAKRSRPVIHGANLKFYISSDTSKLLISESVTDQKGIAIYRLSSEQVVYADTSGLLEFYVEFEGLDSFKSSSKSLEIQRLQVVMEFSEEDSLRYLSILATQLKPNNIKVPVEDLDIPIFVKRTS